MQLPNASVSWRQGSVWQSSPPSSELPKENYFMEVHLLSKISHKVCQLNKRGEPYRKNDAHSMPIWALSETKKWHCQRFRFANYFYSILLITERKLPLEKYHRLESDFPLLRIKCTCTQNLLHLKDIWSKQRGWNALFFWAMPIQSVFVQQVKFMIFFWNFHPCFGIR